MVYDHNPFAELFHILQIVGGEQNGCALLAVDVTDELADAFLGDYI